MTNANDYAFAASDEFGQRQKGVTKREYFAAMALQGIIAAHNIYETGISHETNAQAAVKATDELIKALNQNNNNHASTK